MPGKTANEDNNFQYRLRKTPIAVIGISSVFPQSENLEQYWTNILAEADCITDVPASRWSLDDYYDADPSAPDKTYSKKGGFIPDIDFDPMEFGLPPNILEITDVSQLLSLVMAKRVLQDGNYEIPSEELRKRTGVILGVGGGQKLVGPLQARLQYPIWDRVLKSSGIDEGDRTEIIEKIKKAYVGWEENSFPGTLGNIIAGRICNRLDLGGTNCVVDAACASSLAGIHMAISELLNYRADMMITGGVDTDNSAYMYMCFSKTPAFTQKDVLQPFDKDSAGIMIGEGIGMLLLKRLEDAERDGDRIYSVIRGIGTSSDGRFNSIYAPRPAGQKIALERAYEESTFHPSTIGLLEAHGTGTKAGDVAEVSALCEYFSEHDQEKQHIALGSVKSQIGHTKNAAGVASLIKVSMALYHKVLPATINVNTPNPEFNLEDSPIYLNTETRPWIRPTNGPTRRAGLSAFGFGGTNFHFVLEEHKTEHAENFRNHSVAQQIILTGETKETLLKNCRETLEQLRADDDSIAFQKLYRSCFDLKLSQKEARIGFIAENRTEAIELLEKGINKLKEGGTDESWNLPSGIYYRSEGIDSKGKVVSLFAGQGSPYLNMGKDLIYNFPQAMEANCLMDQLFVDDNLKPLSQISYPRPVFDANDRKKQEERLQLTENAQPAIGVFSKSQFQILKDAGFSPDFSAGHSFGELTALWAAEVLSDEDYFALAKARGKAMAAPDDPNFDAGGMVAIVGDLKNLDEDIKEFPNIVKANFNSTKQIVLAGPKDEVKQVAEKMKGKGYTAVVLGVSAAFHTPLVGHAQKPFAESIKAATFNKPKCPVFSNATGMAHSEDPDAIRKEMEAHILNPVHFTQEIENIHKEGGYFFIEFGPQQIMSKLVSNILRGKPHMTIAMNANPKKSGDRQFREAVVQMRVSGINLGNIDPFQYDPTIKEVKKSPMKISLNGSNFVSEKTKQEFESSLQDGFQVKQAVAPEPKVEKVVEKVYVPVEPTAAQPAQSQPAAPIFSQEPVNPRMVIESVERNLANFYHNQSETLRIHEKFLDNQANYFDNVSNLMRQQADISKSEFGGMRPIPQEVTQSMNRLHDSQKENLKIHEQFLSQREGFSMASFDILKSQQLAILGAVPKTAATNTFQPAPQQPIPVAAPQPVSTPNQQAFNTVAPQANIPAFQPQTPATPQQVAPQANIPAFQPQTPAQPQQPAPAPEPVKPAAPAPAAQAAPAASNEPAEVTGVSKSAIEAALLNVVSEKTGYLKDMLNLDMDMESDLGIDSIKRVEILHGIQEEIEELPDVNPDEMAELRTLQQIVDFMTPKGDAVVSTPSQADSVPAGDSGSASIDFDAVREALLEVVSEKTGYLKDMLELGMDMESDLGIDSIKRVEILHGIQEKIPELPDVNPDELSEMRTLEQIVQKMAPALAATDTKTAAPAVSAPAEETAVSTGATNGEIENALLEVVSEKTGYLKDMLELNMDLESDLGIDSIKRVEIMHGIQEMIPELPDINPDELSELRTLEQIVNKLSSGNNANAATEAPQAADATTTEAAAGGADEASVREALLEVVSEKTGYLKDMLELSMDMESDLGIDSIKRVEILHGIQEKMPDLPDVNPDELSEFRTLQQIVDAMVAGSIDVVKKKTP